MAKINILDSSVYNKISAGEVVERPCSIVKELIENSIDAGSTHITVNIRNGGKTYIEVTDNGCGIDAEYISTAFLPHSTSKIINADDLESVSTLGFRGEALASIASVSKIELITQSINDTIGNRIYLEGGRVESTNSTGRSHGATFVVRDLFYNTPARLKFLKSDRSEQQEITQMLGNLILANPDIAIEYIADDELKYLSSGKGLEDAIFSIYGKSICDNLIPVKKTISNYTVSGYVSQPELTKPNRSYQTTILNGRLITNTTIATAVAKAYDNALMKRAFPLYVLNIVMPFSEVDVNVHPNKTSVRFVDNNVVFKYVYAAVKDSIDKHCKVFSISSIITNELNENTSTVKCEVADYQSIKTDVLSSKIDLTKYSNITIEPNKPLSKHNSLQDSPSIKGDISNNCTRNNIESIKTDREVVYSSMPPTIEIINKANSDVSTDAMQNDILKTFIPDDFFDIDNGDVGVNYKIIGQIFDTYLLVSLKDKVYIIDQHAAHERLLYDKLMDELDNNSATSQPFLFPQIMQLSAVDCDFIISMKNELSGIGLDISEFGNNTIKISSCPSSISNFKLQDFIHNILSNKHKFSAIRLKDSLKEKLTYEACHSAIKAGDKLNDYQIKALLSMMKDNIPLQCPHGRPAIICIDRKDIDKIFKRIL